MNKLGKNRFLNENLFCGSKSKFMCTAKYFTRGQKSKKAFHDYLGNEQFYWKKTN